MNDALLLFGLRVLSALLLLGLLGGMAWLIYQDLRATQLVAMQQGQPGARLRVVASNGGGPALETRYPLLLVTSIGRAGHNTIVLNDSYASNEHARITRRGDQWWLEDLGSRNGTRLNDALLLEPAVLSAGDVIAIGSTHLTLETAPDGA